MEYNSVRRKNFFGQTDEINCIAFSHDYELMICGSNDGKASLYIVKKVKKLKKLERHSGAVKDVAISHNTKYFATCSEDNMIYLYITQNASILHVLKGHIKAVECIKFSQNSLIICSGSWDKTAKLWDVQTGNILKNISCHSTLVQCIAFAKDSLTLALGSWDFSISLWRIDDSNQLITQGQYLSRRYKSKAKFKCFDDHIKLCGHKSNVRCVAFSNNDRLFASGGWDRLVIIWELKTLQALHQLTLHKSWVQSLAWSSNDNFLATVSNFDAVRLWKMTQLGDTQIDCFWEYDLSDYASDGVITCGFNSITDSLIVAGAEFMQEIELLASDENQMQIDDKETKQDLEEED